MLTTPSAIFVSKRLRMSGSSHATNKCVGITVTGADRRIAQFRDPTVGPILIRLAPPCPSPPHTKPSTSWKHELPKFCGCQWRAHSPSRDGRLSTPYARAASGGRRPLTAAKLRKKEASMRSTALPAKLAPVKLAPPLIGHASREALSRFAIERDCGLRRHALIPHLPPGAGSAGSAVRTAVILSSGKTEVVVD